MKLVLAGAAVLAVVASGRSSSGPSRAGAVPGPTGPSVAEPAPVRPSAERAAVLEALYEARADSVRSVFHDADVHFMTGMISHHAQALLMAGFAPGADASPAIRILCARIVNAQQDEIALMRNWLEERGLPAPEFRIEDGELTIQGPAHAMHMPGMLSPEQLDELRQAAGEAFDRLFLEYMIIHHKGAVSMVLDLFATDGAAQTDFVFKVASDIRVDQATEIARMESMLAEMASNTAGRPDAASPQGVLQ